jgi:hypothetical protein
MLNTSILQVTLDQVSVLMHAHEQVLLGYNVAFMKTKSCGRAVQNRVSLQVVDLNRSGAEYDESSVFGDNLSGLLAFPYVDDSAALPGTGAVEDRRGGHCVRYV